MADISPEQQEAFNNFINSVRDAGVTVGTNTTQTAAQTQNLTQSIQQFDKLNQQLRATNASLENFLRTTNQQSATIDSGAQDTQQAFNRLQQSVGTVNFNRLNQQSAKIVEVFSKLHGLTEQQSQAILQANGALTQLGGFNQEVLETIKIQKELEESAKLARDAFNRFGSGLKESAKGMFKAFNNAETGTGKYATSIEKAADTTSDWLSSFGLLGKVIGSVVGVLGSLAAESLKQNDALVKSYFSLSQIGQIDTTDLQSLLRDVQNTGLGVQQIDQYIRIITGVSTEFANMSKSVGGARKTFADVMDTNIRVAEKEIYNLGYTMEQAATTTASYMANLSLLGKTNKRDAADLSKETLGYLRNLSELSALTGASRDQADKARRKQEEDLAFQTYLNEVERTQGKEAANNLRLQVQAYSLTFGEEFATGAKSVIRTQGAVVDDFGAKVLQLVGSGGITDMLAFSKQKFKNDNEAMDTLLKSLKNTASDMEPRFKQFYNQILYGGADSMKELGFTIDTYRAQQALLGKDDEYLAIMRKKLLKKEEDDRIAAFGRQAQAERQTRSALEQFNYTLGNITVPIVTAFSEITRDFARWMAELLKDATGIDYTGFFKSYSTMEEVLEQINESLSDEGHLLTEKQYLDQQEIKLKKRILDLEKITADPKTGTLEKIKADTDLKYLKGTGMAGNYAYDKDRGFRLSDIQEQQQKLESQIRANALTANQAKRSGAILNSNVETETSGPSTKPNVTNPLEGLIIKKGPDGLVHREGSELDPNIVKLAKTIQTNLGNFGYFSSFNDNYHKENSPGSKHIQGKALDFVLGNSEYPDEKTAKQIMKNIQDLMPDTTLKFRDEYNFPSSKSTGGHIHAELQSKMGGYFKGPQSGYWARLHGKEAVFNEQQMTSLNNAITKTNIQGSTGSGDMFGDNPMVTAFEKFSEKLDTLISYQRASNNIQDDILTYTKA